MGRVMCVALMTICLGGLLTLQAVGEVTHSNFAAATYDETVVSPKVDPSSLPETQTSSDAVHKVARFFNTNATNANETIWDRYPGGYPNNSHTSNDTSENTVPEERYPFGYHPNSTYGKEETTAETSAHSSFAQTDSENTTTTTTAVPDRYSAGYPKYLTDPQTDSQSAGRYVNGYYPRSTYGKTETSAQQATSFVSTPLTTSQYQSAQTTPDVPGQRYVYGYYPESDYAGSKPPKTTSTSFVSVDNTIPTNTGRYTNGYFPISGTWDEPSTTSTTSTTPATSAQAVSYSTALGNFETLPYPSAGVPFDSAGSGCRTAYWVAHVSDWPSFFKVTSTVGDAFGNAAVDVYGSTTILQALMNYNSDAYTQLLKSACTALLNSYTRGLFTIPHMKVVEEFNAALVSEKAASAQALVFETANVESISAGNACS